VSNLAKPHFFVGFRISTPRDDEVEAFIACFQHLDLERPIGSPQILKLDEMSHGGDPAGRPFGELPTFADGGFPDRRIENIASLLLSDLGHHLSKNRPDDLGLQSALREGGDIGHIATPKYH